MLARLLGLFSADMAIDLGTANTLIYVKGRRSTCGRSRQA